MVLRIAPTGFIHCCDWKERRQCAGICRREAPVRSLLRAIRARLVSRLQCAQDSQGRCATYIGSVHCCTPCRNHRSGLFPMKIIRSASSTLLAIERSSCFRLLPCDHVVSTLKYYKILSSDIAHEPNDHESIGICQLR